MTRATGKLQPINAEPDPAGNIRLIDEYVRTDHGAAQKCEVIPTDTLFPYTGERWMPHHATCPYADQLRKRKDPTK